MRDINRIDKATALINEAWKTVPDFRLWQFINFMFEFIPENKIGTDPFFWEEDTFIETLEKMIAEAHKNDR